MKSTVTRLLFLLILTGGMVWGLNSIFRQDITGAPPYGAPEEESPDSLAPYERFQNWKRPEGKAKVGIQVGHWKNEELPEELARIRGNTGASGGGVSEAEVNLAIAENVARRLRESGVVVDIIPATVDPEYWADVFIAIHADGSQDPSKSGYKFASPWRDFTGKADSLVALLESEYEAATGLERDPNISRNMRGYYAFAFWRYTHAIHPMTTGVIAETGFLTNWSDRQLLIQSPEIPGEAITTAILTHLENEGLL